MTPTPEPEAATETWACVDCGAEADGERCNGWPYWRHMEPEEPDLNDCNDWEWEP